MRMCSSHPVEDVAGRRVQFIANNGTKEMLKIKSFLAPIPVGKKSFYVPTANWQGGNGTDREIVRHIQKVSQQEFALSPAAQLAIRRERAFYKYNKPTKENAVKKTTKIAMPVLNTTINRTAATKIDEKKLAQRSTCPGRSQK